MTFTMRLAITLAFKFPNFVFTFAELEREMGAASNTDEKNTHLFEIESNLSI